MRRGSTCSPAPLHPVATATSVRIREGKRLVTDGPFAETREQLGGFYLIDVPDLQTAIDIAGRHPGAPLGTVEIRPVVELPGVPATQLTSLSTVRSMVKKILLGLGRGQSCLIAAVLAVVIAMQPSEFHVERSLAMNAPPEAVFAQVNDFHHWEAWSPWLKEDPNAKRTYEGPASGEGAIFRWAGNDKVGEGSMTILESQAERTHPHQAAIHQAVRGHRHDGFHVPARRRPDQGHLVDGRQAQLHRQGACACCVFDMDEMIGGKYEEGLASMKKIVESADAEPAPSETTACRAGRRVATGRGPERQQRLTSADDNSFSLLLLEIPHDREVSNPHRPVCISGLLPARSP